PRAVRDAHAKGLVRNNSFVARSRGFDDVRTRCAVERTREAPGRTSDEDELVLNSTEAQADTPGDHTQRLGSEVLDLLGYLRFGEPFKLCGSGVRRRLAVWEDDDCASTFRADSLEQAVNIVIAHVELVCYALANRPLGKEAFEERLGGRIRIGLLPYRERSR